MQKTLRTTVIFLAVYWHCYGMCQVIQPESSKFFPEVRLPSITKTWIAPDSTESKRGLPEINIADIEKCMGSDMGLQRKNFELLENLHLLEESSKDLDKENNLLAPSSEQLKLKLDQLSESIKKYTLIKGDLDNRRAAIDKLKSQQNMLAVDARRLNDVIQKFNFDVNNSNKIFKDLVAAQTALQVEVNEHNANVGHLKIKVSEYQSKYDSYMTEANEFSKKVKEYASGCTGERQIVH